MSTTIGQDIWHADEDSAEVLDENRLRVLPLEIVKRIERLQDALFWARAYIDDRGAAMRKEGTLDTIDKAL